MRTAPYGGVNDLGFRLSLHDKEWEKHVHIDGPHHEALYRQRGKPAGMIGEIEVAAFRDPSGKKYGKVYQSWVMPEYRNKRVGTAIYLLAYRQAKRRGMLGLASDPSHRNTYSSRVWDKMKDGSTQFWDYKTRDENPVAGEYRPYAGTSDRWINMDTMTSLKPHRQHRGATHREKRNPKQKKLF